MIKQMTNFVSTAMEGFDANSRTPPKAAWTLVCDTKENGGLGILNLHNLKHPHKFFNKQDIPWVHLIWDKLRGFPARCRRYEGGI
jgi:hypothetical protein